MVKSVQITAKDNGLNPRYVEKSWLRAKQDSTERDVLLVRN